MSVDDGNDDLENFVFLDSRQEIFQTHRTIKKEIFNGDSVKMFHNTSSR